MAKSRKHVNLLCTDCGGRLKVAYRRGYGYRCQTEDCDVQKIYTDEEGNIIKIIRSTSPTDSPLAQVQFSKDLVLYEQGILAVKP